MGRGDCVREGQGGSTTSPRPPWAPTVPAPSGPRHGGSCRRVPVPRCGRARCRRGRQQSASTEFRSRHRPRRRCRRPGGPRRGDRRRGRAGPGRGRSTAPARERPGSRGIRARWLRRPAARRGDSPKIGQGTRHPATDQGTVQPRAIAEVAVQRRLVHPHPGRQILHRGCLAQIAQRGQRAARERLPPFGPEPHPPPRRLLASRRRGAQAHGPSLADHRYFSVSAGGRRLPATAARGRRRPGRTCDPQTTGPATRSGRPGR